MMIQKLSFLLLKKRNTSLNLSFIRSVEGTKLRLPLGPPISSLSQRPMEHKVIHTSHPLEILANCLLLLKVLKGLISKLEKPSANYQQYRYSLILTQTYLAI